MWIYIYRERERELRKLFHENVSCGRCAGILNYAAREVVEEKTVNMCVPCKKNSHLVSFISKIN
jgi:hypothetical protein